MLFADILPPSRSSFSGNVDDLFWFIHALSLVSFVAIVVAMGWFVLRWRRGHREGVGPSHNLPLELTWSIVPLILVMAIFLWGFRGYMHMSMPPRGATEIKVTAQKWAWSFEYPNGGSSNQLHVVVGQPVKLTMRSTDVIHSFFVPDFRQKMDVLPGRYTSTWFAATERGKYTIFCAEYCGDGHSLMGSGAADPGGQSFVHAETPAEYDAFLAGISVRVAATPEGGAQLFQTKACFSCHSTDGTPRVGPTMKGVFGKKEVMADGAGVQVDENYLRESIVNPSAKIVKGFPGPPSAMPPYQGTLRDDELDALIAYIKSLQ